MLIHSIIDSIIKIFQYAGFIFVPVILFIIFFLIRIKKLDNTKKKKSLIIVYCLIIFLLVAIITVRIWGPSFYKIIISSSISGKEIIIEQKLEEKYGRNFNFISQDSIFIEENAGNTLGQDINNDYSVKYYFKDDDGVTAIIKYKKNNQSDYYESKRSKYEIEKRVYNYAKEVNFEKKFLVYVESPYESINNSDLNAKAKNDIIREGKHNHIIFILTESSDENQEFIVSALKDIFNKDDYFYVQEYVVTEDEYERANIFYGSISSKNGIANYDYEEHFNFNENNQLHFKYYYVI